MKFTEILDSILDSSKTLELDLFNKYDLSEIQKSLEKDGRFSGIRIILWTCYFKYKNITFALNTNMDLSYKSDYTLLNLTKFRNDMLEKSEKKSIANTVFTMKVRGFITATKGYITFNFLPTIVFEGFKDSTKTIFVGWLIFGIQISWNTH